MTKLPTTYNNENDSKMPDERKCKELSEENAEDSDKSSNDVVSNFIV